jgi:hypothetical protein
MELDFDESWKCDNEIFKAIRNSGISIRLMGDIRRCGDRNWILEGDCFSIYKFMGEYQKLKCRDYNFNCL